MLDFRVTLQEGRPKGQQIIRSLFLSRVKQNKPCIVCVTGGSGEGKSYAALQFLETLEDMPDLHNQIIYTPFEYSQKLKWILFDPAAKDYFTLILMEARELVKSKTWFSVINQSISDVNALSRTIKPIVFIVLSQDINDIDKDIRKTINFFGRCVRPQDSNTKLYLNKVWKGIDLNNPKMYHRRLNGDLIHPDGTTQKITISRFIMTKPSKENIDLFEALDIKAKKEIILKKLSNIDKALNKEMPQGTKIDELVNQISSKPELLTACLKRGRGGVMTMQKYIKDLYGLSTDEFKTLEVDLKKKLIDQGILSAPEKKTIEFDDDIDEGV